jgi:hypothetical protein
MLRVASSAALRSADKLERRQVLYSQKGWGATLLLVTMKRTVDREHLALTAWHFHTSIIEFTHVVGSQRIESAVLERVEPTGVLEHHLGGHHFP